MPNAALKIDQALTFRAVLPEDVLLLHGMIYDLALHDNRADLVNLDVNEFTQNLYREPRIIEPFFIMLGDTVAGFFITYEIFWIYKGRRGMHLLGLYVKPEFRRRGCGEKAFQHIVEECKKRDMGQLVWHADVSNDSGKNFYAKMGATVFEDYSYNFIKFK